MQAVASADGTPACPFGLSHLPIFVNSDEFEAKGVYIHLAGFKIVVGNIFGSRFLWDKEVYLDKLFSAYSVDKRVLIRTDPMTRNNEVRRLVTEGIEGVLRLKDYMEILTLLEEDYAGLKNISLHSLFCSAGKRHTAHSEMAVVNDITELEWVILTTIMGSQPSNPYIPH